MPAIGYVIRDENGSFAGQLRTLSIRAEISIVPNSRKAHDAQPDYRVLSGDVEIGAGWNRRSETSGRDYVSLSLAAPEFGPRRLTPTSAARPAKPTVGSPSSGTRPTDPRGPAFGGAPIARRGWKAGGALVITGSMADIPKLRVARPSDNLDALLPFYCDGLGLAVLYRFEGHAGFDGVMLGAAGAPYHFEFTRARGHEAGRAPNEENLLVFYLPGREEWQAAVERMKQAGFLPVPAFNPYWDERGVTFADPDGYRIVLQHDDWRL